MSSPRGLAWSTHVQAYGQAHLMPHHFESFVPSLVEITTALQLRTEVTTFGNTLSRLGSESRMTQLLVTAAPIFKASTNGTPERVKIDKVLAKRAALIPRDSLPNNGNLSVNRSKA